MKTHLAINKEHEKSKHFFSLSTAHTWSGPLTAVSLILFFLVMRAFNLHEILYLRYLNAVFLFAGIMLALLQYKKHYSEDGIDYLTGLRLGVTVSLTATVPFAFFMALYLMFDQGFMDYIKSSSDFGSVLSPWLAAGSVFIEGISSGVIFTFIVMQYLKRE